MKKRTRSVTIPPILRLNRALRPIEAVLDQILKTGCIDTINDIPVFRMPDQPREWLETVYFIETFAQGLVKGMGAINYNIKVSALLSFAKGIESGSVSEEILNEASKELLLIRKVVSRLTTKQYDIVSFEGITQ